MSSMWTLDHVTFAVRTGVLGPVGGSHGDGQGNGDDGGGGVVMVVVVMLMVVVVILMVEKMTHLAQDEVELSILFSFLVLVSF